MDQNTQSTPTPPVPKGRSGPNPWLLGCGLGCGGLFVICLLAFVALARWASAPSVLPREGALLKPDTHSYFKAELSSDDNDLMQLIAGALAPGDELAALQIRQGAGEALPARFEVIVIEPGNEAAGVVAVVGLSRYANIMRFALSGALKAEQNETYRQHTIAAFRPKRQDDLLSLLSMVDNSVILASTSKSAHAAIDSLLDVQPGNGSERFRELRASLIDESGLFGVITNHAGQLRDRVLQIGQALDMNDLSRPAAELLQTSSGVALTSRIESDELLTDLVVHYDDPMAAQAMQPAWAELLEKWLRTRASEPQHTKLSKPLNWTTQAEVDTSIVRIQLRTEGLLPALIQNDP